MIQLKPMHSNSALFVDWNKTLDTCRHLVEYHISFLKSQNRRSDSEVWVDFLIELCQNPVEKSGVVNNLRQAFLLTPSEFQQFVQDLIKASEGKN